MTYTRPQIIGIVGSSKASWEQCGKIISHIIDNLPDRTVIVTGDALGVDHWVEIYCIENLISFSKIYSKTNTWEGFKKRNLLIADYCDKIYSLALPMTDKPCYHCHDSTHEKTAGCYTGKKNGNYEVMVLEANPIPKGICSD